MTRARGLTVEPSRDDGWGIPYRSWSGRDRAARRAAVGLVAVAALVIAAAARRLPRRPAARAGVSLSADGTRISPSPVGFALAAVSARPDGRVLDSISPGGWRLHRARLRVLHG
jgi:hypothetical protein